jgi:nucleoside-diphosphate kinase
LGDPDVTACCGCFFSAADRGILPGYFKSCWSCLREREARSRPQTNDPGAAAPATRACMTVERTLSIVKPDGVRKNVIGEVYRRFEKAGLAIVAARMTRLSTAQAEAFYAIHRQRPFFRDLVSFMTSGPVMLQVLEGADAVAKNREIMGATDPKQAAPGTIRADLASSIDQNVVHGSDSVENAAVEVAFFFPQSEICPR